MNSPKNKPFPFSSILEWFTKNGRHALPSRQIYHLPNKERLYHIWIAEVMLQQTQVDRVIGYYTRFIEKYPTIESLAATTYEELFPYYQGLGYYSRARRMIELARVVVSEYDGIFPDTFDALKKLPGIGVYTAQALLAFGYNQSVLAIDANLEKIFARYYLGTRYYEKQKLTTIIPTLSGQLENEKIGGRDINNALMDFGALISTSIDTIDKVQYPLKECLWFQTVGSMEQKEKKEKKINGTKTQQYCLVFLHENHRKYWSSHAKHYEPFLIEPFGKDDRKTIQDYFSATYGLEVSVRPSFGNGKIIPELSSNNPGVELNVKLFHAQIQTGNFRGPCFSKTEKEHWISESLLIF